jgi:hypothetical protein
MGKFTTPPPPPTSEANYGIEIPFLGLNVRDVEMKIRRGQSPSMQNVNLDDRGAIAKRRGQEYIFTESLGVGAINGFYKELYSDNFIFVHSTSMYFYDHTEEGLTEVYTGLMDAKGRFYSVNDVLYYKNGTEFLLIDTSYNVYEVSNDAYVPVIVISKNPDGTGGTANEDFNLIGSGFEEWFTGTAGVTEYQLSLTGLDATLVKAWVLNGTWTEKIEDTDFTVNRTTGKVTFTIAPGDAGGANNVKIRAYLTVSGYKERIYQCPYSELYGGATNDSRAFTAGNPDYPSTYWYTGNTGDTDTSPLYWPENNFNRLGSDIKYIRGWTKLYSKLLAIKEPGGGIYSLTYNSTGIEFTVSTVNPTAGCDMPDSIQIINNLPVFFNTKSGGWTIVSTNEVTEKNVMPLSDLVNGSRYRQGILDESVTDLENASSFDDGEKYYLCVGSKVWVWDYTLSPYAGNQDELIWFYYTNMNANHWGHIDREIYYGDRIIGQLIRFKDSLNDFDAAIDAYYKTDITDFGYPNNLKTFTDMWYSAKPVGETTTTIEYYTNKPDGYKIESESVAIETWNWDAWDWDTFSWYSQKFPTKERRKPKLKNIETLQVKFSNNRVNEDLSILDLTLKATIGQKIK